MIISISGKPGSGKSTIAQMLAEELDFKRYYMGGLRRKMAQEKGMTLEELNQLGEKEFFTDQEVDEYQKKLGQEENNFVIEGRTSFFLIPHSLKIFLDVEPREGARRIFSALQKNQERNEAKNLKTAADVLTSIKKRIKSDERRYQKYYHVDVFEMNLYDFVLDTTNLTIQEVFKKVLDFVKSKM